MSIAVEHPWDLSPAEARDLQLRLRDQLVARPPSDLRVRRLGGADLSMSRRSRRGFGGVVVLDSGGLSIIEQQGGEAELTFPYVPGLLSFRELPIIESLWERLAERPDVLIFDGHGYAHPRRFGLACHGGVVLGVPSIGCAKSLLVGSHGPLGAERGATAPIVHREEVVGMAVRTRARVRPVYVSIGHRMDLPTAVEIVLSAAPRYREPETTRAAHRLVNDLRRRAAG